MLAVQWVSVPMGGNLEGTTVSFEGSRSTDTVAEAGEDMRLCF